MKPETEAIRLQLERTQYREHAVPLFMTSSFTFDSAEHARALFTEEVEGFVYSRYGNPNTEELVKKLVSLENAEDGIATASGMAAVFATLAGILHSGDHLVACRSIFGSTHQIITQILTRWGIEYTYVDATEPETWPEAIKSTTKMFFVETPTNPTLDVLDLDYLRTLTEETGIILVVDNCFATPYLQKPMDFGTGIVIHSATKYIDGQGRTIGGAVVGKQELIDRIWFFTRHTGPSLSPFNAWLLSKSLETLSVRMRAHCENALALAEEMERSPSVAWVRYPHLPSHPQYEIAKLQMSLGGAIVTFELSGGIEQGRKFLDSLKLLSHTANLGDSRTIATHPASTTHSKLKEEERLAVGITPGLIRISVGLEHIEDIKADILQAIAASKN